MNLKLLKNTRGGMAAGNVEAAGLCGLDQGQRFADLDAGGAPFAIQHQAPGLGERGDVGRGEAEVGGEGAFAHDGRQRGFLGHGQNGQSG